MSTFNSLLAKVPVGLNKAADVESPDEVQLEQDFGRLAYTFLKDRAAGLIPYLLGFEVVEREEDGSKAVGIFGFKLGEDFYYVPAFFVNGQVKGMDLLFSKRTNMFMPLKEGWINHIVNKQTITLGEAEMDADGVRKDLENPDFDFLAYPPQYAGSKNASAVDSIHDGFETWNQMQKAMVESLEKDAEFQKAWGGFIARCMKADLPFDKTAESSDLIHFLQNKGGITAVNALMKAATSDSKFASAILDFYPTVESLYVTEFNEALKPKEAQTKVTVETEVKDYMDGKMKSKIIRDGFVLNDDRDAKEQSEVYDVDYERRFSSPDSPGLYNVLLRSGGTVKAFVFMPAGKKKYMGNCVVVHPDGEHYFLAEPGAVFVRDEEDLEGPKPQDKAIDLKNMKIGGTYVLISSDLSATCPMEIRSIVAENGKRTKMRVYTKDYPIHKRPTYGHDFEALHRRSCCSPEEYHMVDWIELSDDQSMKLRINGDTIVVPSTWKAIEVDTKQDNLDDYETRKAREAAFCPGTLDDVMNALTKNAVHHLQVGCDDGLEYYIRFDRDFVDGPAMSYKTASVRLVKHYGLAPKEAENMLKEAKDNFKSRRLVKLGQMVGVNMPPPPPQPMSQDGFTGVPLEYPQADLVDGQTIGADVPQNTVQPGFNLGGEAEMDQAAAQLANEAAAAGQKQVFDHAAIGGLSRLYDTGAVIDGYIPELLQALDRLGRVLFLYYWKNEDFAERYGNEDMADMEDMLRGVFKSYGDLVLQLKQKAIDADDAEAAVVI